MSDTPTHHRWWLNVSGDEWAFRLLHDDLPSISVRERNGAFQLASEHIDEARSISELWVRADEQMAELNELSTLTDWRTPFHLTGPALEIQPDGTEKSHYRLVAGTGYFELTGVRARLIGIAMGPDGKLLPSPRSLLERSAELRKRNPGFKLALARMDKAGLDRRELYKVWERIRFSNGWRRGSKCPRGFYTALGTNETDATRFSESAHLDRHEDPDPVTDGELSAKDMRTYIAQILTYWVNRDIPA